MTQTPSPSASLASGRYASSLSVSLQSQQPATVHYTLDGSEPSQASPLYTSPIAIGKTSVLRARSFASGELPSSVASFSYIIAEPTPLATLSVVTDPNHLFDESTGIYSYGNHAEATFPFWGANFNESWTRPAHVTFTEANGQGFSKDVGIELFGVFGRRTARKSIELKTTGAFSGGSIDYPIFPGYSVSSFENLILRSSSNDWDKTIFRDVLTQSLMTEAGLDTQAARPVVVYVNGEYWGVFHLREKMDEKYVEAHFGVKKKDLDLLEGYIGSSSSQLEVKEGSEEAFLSLFDYIKANDLSNPNVYAKVAEQLDIENFIAYSAAQIYMDNYDWPGNNIRFWKSQAAGSKWRWLVYDTDYTFALHPDNSYATNTLGHVLSDDPGPYWKSWAGASVMLQKLLENDSFRRAFIQKFRDYSVGVFEPSHVINRINQMEARLEPEMTRHLERWGPSHPHMQSVQDWKRNVQALRDFAQNRPAYIQQHLIEVFGQSAVAEVYGYTPRPSAGFYAQAVNPVVINEINYNSPEDRDSDDWLELFNPDATTIDLSGWMLMDQQDDTPFTLPPNTVIEAGGFLVLCRNSESFSAIYNQPCIGNWDFGLKGGGELVRLVSPEGETVDSLSYDDEAPWPLEADGLGATLELTNAELDNALAPSWKASQIPGGTPGQMNSVSSGTN